MSFFISCMQFGGLEVEPAAVEADALADQGHLGSPPPQRKSISRGARLLARPTAWMQG